MTAEAILNETIQKSLNAEELTDNEKNAVGKYFSYLDLDSIQDYCYMDNKGNIYTRSYSYVDAFDIKNTVFQKKLGTEYAKTVWFIAKDTLFNGKEDSLFITRYVHSLDYPSEPGIIILKMNPSFLNHIVTMDSEKADSSILTGIDVYKRQMQHKYPFVVLYLDVDTEHVDVNVHPTKMDVRFNNQQEIYNTLLAAVDDGLHERELIPEVTLDDIKIPEEPKDCKSNFPEEPKESKKNLPKKSEAEHTEKLRTSLQSPQNEDEKLQYFMNEMKKRVYSYHEALHENKQETTPALSNTDSCKPQKNVSVQDSYKPVSYTHLDVYKRQP